MPFIGIDLGTSFIKGAVLDVDGLRLSHIVRVPFPTPLPGLPTLHCEYDTDVILAAVRQLLHDLLPHALPCEGLVMCSQMHGLVLTNARGQPASNLTTWQDTRALEPHPSGQGSYFEVLRARLSADETRQLGNELRPDLPVSVLFWLAEQGRLPREAVFPASLPDFVLANLCGVEPTTEITNAAAHGALNLETGDWHGQVLGKLGLDGLRWPTLRRQGEVVGHLRFEGQVFPCYTPVGDYQCALVGALLQPEELSLNISTGCQVSLITPGPEFGDFQTRPFFDGRYLKAITNVPAGRALNALVRLLSELAEAQGVSLEDPWDYIIRSATAVSETRLRVNLAFFPSSCGDRGEIINLREEEMTVGHLFRAAFQNIADNCYASALRLSPERSWQGLVLSGGLAQKIALLRQLIHARFQVGYRLCPTSEDTLLGLLALARAFSGRADSVAQATVWARRRRAHTA